MTLIDTPAPADSPRHSLVEFRSADGLRLVGSIVGDGPPVILLHGGGQTRGAWHRTAQQLAARGYRAISVDARGHGDSDWSTRPYDVDAFAEDLRTIVADVGRAPAMVGASMGGLTALYALGMPNPVPASALVLVDIAARTNREGTNAIATFMRAYPNGFASLDEAADAVALYMTDRPRPKNVEGLRRNLRERDGRLYWHWDPAVVPPTEDVAAERSWRQGKVEEAARHIRQPTILIRGEHSKVIDAESIAHMREIMPHVETVELAGAGHMVAGDANSPFGATIIDFLGRVYPPG
jgi:pimeloyl-ACP methyl ester carboxylesterase